MVLRGHCRGSRTILEGRKVSHQTFVDVADLKRSTSQSYATSLCTPDLAATPENHRSPQSQKLVYPAEDNHWYKIALKPHRHHRHQTTHQGLFGLTHKIQHPKTTKTTNPKTSSTVSPLFGYQKTTSG